jgi:hypothetical protein
LGGGRVGPRLLRCGGVGHGVSLGFETFLTSWWFGSLARVEVVWALWDLSKFIV